MNLEFNSTQHSSLKTLLYSFFFPLLLLTQTSQAALTNIGGGLVNDSTLNITWLQDANMVNTLCKANDPLWQSWPEPNPAVANNSGRTKVQICTDTAFRPFTAGRLNWYEAENWIAHLNTNNYLGHNDWRQPTTAQPDATCESIDGNGQNFGYNCRGSELGNLFNTSLANPNHGGIGFPGAGTAGGVAGTGCNAGTWGPAPVDCWPFSNAHSSAYWSGSTYAQSFKCMGLQCLWR